MQKKLLKNMKKLVTCKWLKNENEEFNIRNTMFNI